MTSIENLVFEGGGVRGIAYIGALKYMNEKGLLSNVKKIAGSSIGALIGSLIAIGYKAHELQTLFMDFDIQNILDADKCLCSIFKNFGFYKGKQFVKYFKQLVFDKLGKKDCTLGELYQKNGIKLYICVTELNRQIPIYLNTDDNFDVLLSDAVRWSISIPGIFQVKKTSKKIFVDGGVLNNFPINIFDSELDKTIGLKLIDKCEKSEQCPKEINNIKEYTESLINSMLSQIERGWLKNEYWLKTVPIDTLGVNSYDFEITSEKKSMLIDQGYTCCKRFFEK